MAQIGTIRLQTQNNGTVDVPVFDTGDSGSSVYEFVRVQTAGGTGFIPADASYPYLRVQTQNNGIVAVNDTATLGGTYDGFTMIDDWEDQETTTPLSPNWGEWQGDTSAMSISSPFYPDQNSSNWAVQLSYSSTITFNIYRDSSFQPQRITFPWNINYGVTGSGQRDMEVTYMSGSTEIMKIYYDLDSSGDDIAFVGGGGTSYSRQGSGINTSMWWQCGADSIDWSNNTWGGVAGVGADGFNDSGGPYGVTGLSFINSANSMDRIRVRMEGDPSNDRQWDSVKWDSDSTV